ncbi:hypothetical protein NA57DRAFT_72239 [Rhizodiscina lignyota]|uniref:C2H2-type domain-containing protein n=1 Tax=Rhizodiscina lignyota TaxID=1504668 RepID=A0A9P4IPF8_9PEZI|nr:hypothetical protein NA57DRAFT_72239 [Rhizodiscina lignyota]
MVARRERAVPVSTTLDNSQAALQQKAENFDPSRDAEKNLSENTKALISLVERRWNEYHSLRGTNRDEELVQLKASTIYGFLDWMLMNFRINKDNSLRTYWDALRTLHMKAACAENVNPVITYLADGIRAQLSMKYGLIPPGDVTEQEEKRCVRSEEMFAFEQTLWCSKRMTFKSEDLRAEISVAMNLAGLSTSRPAALLGLKWGDIKFVLYPDELRGDVPTIKIRFNGTKTYLGPKKPKTHTYPAMYESCLLLDPQVAMFGLAIGRKIFHPLAGLKDASSIYSLRVPTGLKRQVFPLDSSKLDTPVFSELTYSILRNALKRIAEDTSIEWDTKPYSFRYGGGEGINLSKDISPEQQALVMDHQKIDVYQRNYQSNDIRADLQASFHGTTPQSDIIRLATSMIQSQDPRRPKGLDDAQRDQLVNNDPEVVKCRQEWQNAKLKRKRDESTSGDEQVKKKKNKYLAAKKKCERRVVDEVKDRFSQEQPVLDIQRQLQGLPVEIPSLETAPEIHHLPERREAISALMVRTTSDPGNEAACRARAVQAIANLCGKRERYVPGRSGRRAVFAAVKGIESDASESLRFPSEEKPIQAFPIECEETQCIFCLGDESMSYEDRTRQYANRSSLSRHMSDEHFSKWNGGMICPHPSCSVLVDSVNGLKSHAELDHKTPLPRQRSAGFLSVRVC